MLVRRLRERFESVVGIDLDVVLVSDGGVLAIEVLARSTNARDLLDDAIGSMLTQILKRTGSRTYYEHSAPIRSPKDSFSDIRSIAVALLPGVRNQRHALWRYTLIWHRAASL